MCFPWGSLLSDFDFSGLMQLSFQFWKRALLEYCWENRSLTSRILVIFFINVVRNSLWVYMPMLNTHRYQQQTAQLDQINLQNHGAFISYRYKKLFTSFRNSSFQIFTLPTAWGFKVLHINLSRQISRLKSIVLWTGISRAYLRSLPFWRCPLNTLLK